MILDVAAEADKEAAKQQQQGSGGEGQQKQLLQPVPADLVRGVLGGLGVGWRLCGWLWVDGFYLDSSI